MLPPVMWYKNTIIINNNEINAPKPSEQLIRWEITNDPISKAYSLPRTPSASPTSNGYRDRMDSI